MIIRTHSTATLEIPLLGSKTTKRLVRVAQIVTLGVCCFFCYGTTVSVAEEPAALELPDCDIFVFNTTATGDALKLSSPKNVTQRPGYDNQPWFTPLSASLLYVANVKPDRTDVFEYFFENGETKQVTNSATQEYSPQISPDNKTLSFVADGPDIRQSIWSMDRHAQAPTWLLKSNALREPVGYYSWNHTTGHILFWSRYGFSLRLTHQDKALSHFVCGNAVPSSPLIIPGSDRFSFVHRQANEAVWIKELDPITLSVRPLLQLPSDNANYAWTPQRKLLLFDGLQLKMAKPEPGAELIDVADLGKFGIAAATRVAVSPDGKRVALVGLPADD